MVGGTQGTPQLGLDGRGEYLIPGGYPSNVLIVGGTQGTPQLGLDGWGYLEYPQLGLDGGGKYTIPGDTQQCLDGGGYPQLGLDGGGTQDTPNLGWGTPHHQDLARVSPPDLGWGTPPTH